MAIIREGDGDDAFEEAVIAPWLAGLRFDGRLVATGEPRVQGDVSDELAWHDADGIYRLLGARRKAACSPSATA